MLKHTPPPITDANLISPSGNIPIHGKYPMVPLNSVARNVKDLEAVPIRPERLCREIERALPAEALLVSDTGHAGAWTGTRSAWIRRPSAGATPTTPSRT